MKIRSFNIENALEYAYKWALSRNPDYYDFQKAELGGDCANFVSQCVYAGSEVMNHARNYGWYYKSLNDRAPAWSGTVPFYNFITNNKGIGPFGIEVALKDVKPGDIAQLLFWDKDNFSHTMIVLKVDAVPNFDNVLIACHTFDALLKPLSAYFFKSIRFIRILGVRINTI